MTDEELDREWRWAERYHRGDPAAVLRLWRKALAMILEMPAGERRSQCRELLAGMPVAYLDSPLSGKRGPTIGDTLREQLRR
jgi:hypothetical protein